MVPWRSRGACRLPGEGDLGSPLKDPPTGHGVGTSGHRAILAKDPHGLEGDMAQPPGEELQAGGRQTGRGDGWEKGGTPSTHMPLRASAASQALYQSPTCYVYYF